MIGSGMVYKDCMDLKFGLPSIPDGEFDLCLTDPPYNVKYKNSRMHTIESVVYEDAMDPIDYRNWCIGWFVELKRICNGIVLTPGDPNEYMWEHEIQRPRGKAVHYKPNCQSVCSIAYLKRYEIIFFYGKFNGKLNEDVIVANKEIQYDLIHPCPKSDRLWEVILKALKPTSVIDPFMGSGTTAEVCERLGIPWMGYEINPNYKVDIDRRMARGIEERNRIGVANDI